MNVERNLFAGTIAAIIVVVLLAVVYLGEDARMAHEVEAQQGKLIARGARLYVTYCSGCHGQRGEGLPGIYPPLNVEDLWSGKEDLAFYGTLHDYIALNISAGHPSQNMPSWADEFGGPLRNDQVEDLTQFVLNWMGPQPEGVRVEAAELVPVVVEVEPDPSGEPAAEPGQDTSRGGSLFASACARCHGANASGTDLGPTLVGAQAMGKDDSALHDTIANGRTGTSMPSWGDLIGSQDVDNIIAYLRALAGGEVEAVAAPEGEADAGEAPLLALPQGDPDIGLDLFTGARSLQNGGPSCLMCHSVATDEALGGGTLGPDLTSAFDSYGDLGLAGVLADIAFPTMQPIYADHALTSDEQMHLRTFLQASSARQSTQPLALLFVLAGGGFVTLMLLTHVVWRRRLGGVRRSLVERKRSEK